MDLRSLLKVVAYGSIFAVPFVVLVVSESLFFPFITGKNFAFRILVEIALSAWVLLALLDKTYRPRFSYIALGGAALLAVMFVANILGEYPPKSFWSNFERMDGYVTLVHFYLYFMLLGTLLSTEKLWNRFFNATLVAALLVSFYGFAQLSGNIDITQGGWRINSTLGNASYMAIYMLFHVFISLWMLCASSNRYLRVGYGALALLFAYLLFTTATRGTMLGLLGGGLLGLAYIAMFSKGAVYARRVAISGLILLVLFVGAFVAFRNADFVQNNPVLERFANIAMAKDDARFIIWGLAWQGIKERPVLGWGQENFSYVFNKYYDPRLYNAEQWYDRVHNIALDWLIAGGILGALCYFSILAAAVYYVFIRPLRLRFLCSLSEDELKTETGFTTMEQGLLIGILAAYVFHNLFVFDSLVSYIFFAVLLALMHSRVAREMPSLATYRMDENVVTAMAAPLTAAILVAVIYFLNVPAILASKDVIDALKQGGRPEPMYAELQSSIDRGAPFGRQEAVEQMAQNAIQFAINDKIAGVTKQKIFSQVELEYLSLIKDKPGDARLHILFGSYYRFAGKPAKALQQFEIAKELSPRKQTVFYAIGFTYMQIGDHENALPNFKTAYELEPSSPTSRINYAVAALYAGNKEIFQEFINTEDLQSDRPLRVAFVNDDLAVQAVYEMKDYPLLIYMLSERMSLRPDDVNTRVNLAIAYYETGNTTRAVEILNQAVKDIPSFKKQGQEIIADMLSGKLETR